MYNIIDLHYTLNLIMQLKKRNIIPETIIISLIIGGVSLIFTVDNIFPSPHTMILITSLFLAFWHGRLAGVLSFLCATAVYMGGRFYLGKEQLPPMDALLVNGTLAVVLSYLGGSLNQFRLYQIDKILTRYRKMSDEKSKLKEISLSQHDIIRELEERVTRQRSSLNLLYDRILEVDCLDTNISISSLLDTIIHFSETSRISLWVYDNLSSSLKLKMRKGEEIGENNTDTRGLKESIEGWVFRNNQLFSIRMAMDYDSLAALNTENSIICCPVVLDNKIWGVINLESLPFIKYSSYTENMIQIIISLAQPALKRALDFESLLNEEEENEYTGLPQFTQLYRVLERYKYDESGTINSSSLVILEFQEFRELIDKYGLKEIQLLQAQLMEELSSFTKSKPEMFHYREESRVALYISYLDYDGCSLFCLESLEFLNSRQWDIHGDSLKMEVNLGYASCGTSEKMDPDDLLKRAEYLLEIQKI
ncbi:MAG: hypothetical protein B6241_07615 [Spirochaetaceae bacterium 4572_59]|nr:MAG: hypothetical protein B6241_07615 [Spirochaetaceae bacterium 4572_59]